jgi:hypothetical protein
MGGGRVDEEFQNGFVGCNVKSPEGCPLCDRIRDSAKVIDLSCTEGRVTGGEEFEKGSVIGKKGEKELVDKVWGDELVNVIYEDDEEKGRDDTSLRGAFMEREGGGGGAGIEDRGSSIGEIGN